MPVSEAIPYLCKEVLWAAYVGEGTEAGWKARTRRKVDESPVKAAIEAGALVCHP